jgi:hypothetical protein
VRLAAIAVRVARPMAAPSCWEVLTIPDARPASSELTPAVATRRIVSKASPMPALPTRTPGRM